MNPANLPDFSAALAGVDTLRGEEVRRREEGIHLSFFLSEEEGDTVLTSAGDRGTVLHPLDRKEILTFPVILDASTDPLIVQSDELTPGQVYIYFGTGTPSQHSRPLLGTFPMGEEGLFHLAHPAAFLARRYLPGEERERIRAISLQSIQGASFDSRQARDRLVDETIGILNDGPKGEDHRAYNIRPEPSAGSLPRDLSAIFSGETESVAESFQAPFFHGLVIHLTLVTTERSDAQVLYDTLMAREEAPAGKTSLFKSIRDERVALAGLALDGHTLTFTLFADEIIHGILPNLEGVLDTLKRA